MGSTANRAIPYVEPSDPLAQWPTTDKAAADRLDELLYDTGWVNITISAGFAAVAAPDNPQCRRVGSVVYTRGAWAATGIGVNASHAVGTLPAGFRPLVGILFRAGTTSGSNAQAAATWILAAAGSVTLRTNATLGANYHLVGAFPID